MPIRVFFFMLRNFSSVGRNCISPTDLVSISLHPCGATRKHLRWSVSRLGGWDGVKHEVVFHCGAGVWSVLARILLITLNYPCSPCNIVTPPPSHHLGGISRGLEGTSQWSGPRQACHPWRATHQASSPRHRTEPSARLQSPSAACLCGAGAPACPSARIETVIWRMHRCCSPPPPPFVSEYSKARIGSPGTVTACREGMLACWACTGRAGQSFSGHRSNHLGDMCLCGIF